MISGAAQMDGAILVLLQPMVVSILRLVGVPYIVVF